MTLLPIRPFAAVAAILLLGGGAAAQELKSGPVVFRNTSGGPLTLANVKYTDASGNAQTLTGTWEVKAGFYGHLTVNKVKIVARKFACDVVTADGRTGWTWDCKSVDANGDFVALFTADTLTEHRKVLGKVPAAPPVVALRPAAKGPTDEDIARGVVKVVGAVVLHEAAKKPASDLAEAFAIEFARAGRDELIKSAVGDLFPQLPARDGRLLADMVCLAFDGRLTPANLTQTEAKAALTEYLRKQSPDLAVAAEAADFLSRVQKSARK